MLRGTGATAPDRISSGPMVAEVKNMVISEESDNQSAMSKRHRTFVGVIVGLCLIVYGQTIFFGFITYDDPEYSYANEYIRNGLSLESLRWAVSLDTTTSHSNWIPLTFLSLMIDAELFGNRAAGYHLTNVVLHVGNSLLLFFVFCRMTGRQTESAIVACLFAVHPLHVESVAWVTERKDVLSTFFGFATLLYYVRWVQTRIRWNYVVALVAFLLSLLAKQTLVTLPFLLLLLDFWPLRRFTDKSATVTMLPPKTKMSEGGEDIMVADNRATTRGMDWSLVAGRLLEKVPFLTLSLLFSATVYFAQRDAMDSMNSVSATSRIANAGIAVVLYVKRTVWPAGLGIHYPHPAENVSLEAACLCWLLIAVVSIVAVLQVRRRPWLAVGWFWFLGTLVPVIGLVQVGDQQMADRYMYVPQTGLVLAIVWTVWGHASTNRWPARRVKMLWTTAVFALSCTAILQTALWRDSRLLYEHTLEHTQNNAKVLHLMATLLSERGQWEESVMYFERAVGNDFQNPTLAASFGATLAQAGRHEEARRMLLRAIELQPDHVNARTDLASLEEMRGNLDAALEHVRAALLLDSDSPDLNVWIARLLMQQGEFSEAEQILRHSVGRVPTHALSWAYLGFVLLETDRRAEAIKCFEISIRNDPTDDLARSGLLQARAEDR
jgi:protein O-mannosyl-transferase